MLTTLKRKAPDRVPIDLASTHVTGISLTAYKNLCTWLDYSPAEITISDAIQQISIPDEALLQKFAIDSRGLFPLTSHNNFVDEDDGEYLWHVDEWGLWYRFKKGKSLWYDLFKNPMAGKDLSREVIDKHRWPTGNEIDRFAGLKEKARQFREAGYAVVLKSICAGLLEMAIRLRGLEDCLIDLLINKKSVEYLLDKILEIKLNYWETAIGQLGELVDVLAEGDDFGTQTSQLISYQLFKEVIKPRQKILISTMKKLAPQANIFFHSCGNIRPFIPDFIDMGIDIINPVPITAAGMEPRQLKKDFGKDVVFWGGGIDTQGTLPKGTPDQVRDEVKRNLDIFAPGGGFVFNTIHNIQADVPAENLLAMYETVLNCGKY